MRKSIALSLLLGLTCAAAVLAVSEPRLVADLATVPSPYEGSKPHGLTTIGAQVVFAAQPDDHSDRLFRSDGTLTGTSELAAPCAVGERGAIALLHASPVRAFYRVSCSDRAAALWTSDGTVAGTIPLLGAGEFQPAWPFYPAPGWVEEGARTLFLQGGNYASPLELWRTDGTAAGTIRLALLTQERGATGAIARRADGAFQLLVWEHFASLAVWESDGTVAGTALATAVDLGTTSFGVRSFASTESGIFFVLELGSPGAKELWHSDGTGAGTLRLATFDTGVWDDLVAHAGAIYFSASTGGAAGIWRSDGTTATTRRIAALDNLAISPTSFAFLNERIYCLGFAEDWSSGSIYSAPLAGGSPEELLQQCVGGFCYPLYENLWIETVGDRLVFSRREPGVSTVWSSDGVFGGTPSEIAPLCNDAECQWTGHPPVFEGDDLLFLRQLSGPEALELWRSGGTADSTFRLAGPFPVFSWPPSGGESPLGTLPGDGGWLFAAGDEVHGLELWRARPQADSGALVEDLRLDRPGLFNPEPVGTVGSIFVFALMSPDGNERTLYRHSIEDGPVEPFLTVPVQRGRHGIRNSPPSLRVAGNAWFFIEHDLGGEGRFAEQIWRYDPVSRDLRTLFAEDPRVTGIGARADDLVPSGSDFLFLGSIDPQLHPAIYRLRPRSGAISKLMDLPAEDATSVGQSGDRWYLIEDGERVVAIDLGRRTRTVLDDFPAALVGQAVALADGLVFGVDWQVSGEDRGLELWQSSGDGTRLVAQWPSTVDGCQLYLELPPKGSASPALFAAQTYCSLETAELWVSDGSFDRTRRLRGFPQDHLDFARQADRLRGSLYLLASSFDEAASLAKYEVWKTDGTAAGTERVAELPAELFPRVSDFTEAATGAEAIYFAWWDNDHGRELWRTDGTSAGTRLAADIEPGPESSSPGQLRPVGDQVIFRAGTATTGLELWQVDGGYQPAQPVADLFPGIESSAPLMLGTAGESLYFLADDGVVGREIWEVHRPSVAPCVADATTLCLADGRFRARAVRRDFTGELGAAAVVPLTGDSGYFWFFDEGNPEVMLKIVNACGLPGFENFWSYSTGLTNVEVDLEVVDTVTGVRQRIGTALGQAFGPNFDSGSFHVCEENAEVAPAWAQTAPGITPASPVLPLLDGRFEATATWETWDGRAGEGEAVAISGDSGYFWFFAPSIVEVLVKMVDACGYPGFDNFWVFAGGLTDVEVHLVLRDTWSGLIVSHHNSPGAPFTPLLETGALRVCNSPH